MHGISYPALLLIIDRMPKHEPKKKEPMRNATPEEIERLKRMQGL